MKNDAAMTRLIAKSVFGVVILVLGIVIVSCSVTTVGPEEIVIKQSAFSGQLEVWNSPGVHFQAFGRLVRFKKSDQYWFSDKKDEGKEEDESIKVRFNDGGHANISGSVRYNLPLDEGKMLKLYSTYGSAQAIEHELIKQVVTKSVYLTGPLMSSRESYAEKRSDLINYITDQISHGVYKTERRETKVVDSITGQEKTVDVMEPKFGQGPNGIEREEDSPIDLFGMTVNNVTINDMSYDPQVEEQIKQQQQAIMAVQQAMVNAKKAEQDALTTEQQGKAAAAKAKWDQEVIKATEITKAEQDKDVATLQAEKDKEVAALALETARLNAQQTITTAKADADAKRLQVTANNNLQERLNAYVEVNKNYAAALAAQRQTPDIVLGGGGNSNAAGLMDMFMIKTARDLGVTPKP